MLVGLGFIAHVMLNFEWVRSVSAELRKIILEKKMGREVDYKVEYTAMGR